MPVKANGPMLVEDRVWFDAIAKQFDDRVQIHCPNCSAEVGVTYLSYDKAGNSFVFVFQCDPCEKASSIVPNDLKFKPGDITVEAGQIGFKKDRPQPRGYARLVWDGKQYNPPKQMPRPARNAELERLLERIQGQPEDVAEMEIRVAAEKIGVTYERLRDAIFQATS